MPFLNQNAVFKNLKRMTLKFSFKRGRVLISNSSLTCALRGKRRAKAKQGELKFWRERAEPATRRVFEF